MMLCLLVLGPAGAGASEDSSAVESQAPAAEFEDDYSFDDEFELLLGEEDDLPDAEGFPDPIERANRKILKFNQFAIRWAIGPATRAYAFLVPDGARFAVRRFFKNLNAPVTFTNDVLQLEWRDAGLTTGAFVLNSTIGIGGLFAPAEKLGFPRHQSDFGQTLALARVDSGPYLVIPVLGPTNLRDGTGKIVDLFMRPATWFLGFGVISILAGASEGIVVMETHQRDFEELESSSLDFYPVLRSAYYQNRMGEIWDRREGHER